MVGQVPAAAGFHPASAALQFLERSDHSHQLSGSASVWKLRLASAVCSQLNKKMVAFGSSGFGRPYERRLGFVETASAWFRKLSSEGISLLASFDPGRHKTSILLLFFWLLIGWFSDSKVVTILGKLAYA